MANSNDETSHDLISLLSSDERDTLVRNDGDQVKIGDLVGKVVGLYFSGSWCGPCRRFSPELVRVYQELSSKGENFEVVFVSSDRDEESFSGYFAKMPWLAVPYSDSGARKRLKELFRVRGIPHLLILDGVGKVCCDQGVRIIKEYGTKGYPFTPEIIKILKEEEEAAKNQQSLSSVLVYGPRDFLIANDGKKVLVSELEGKTVCLYFSLNSHGGCLQFLPKLVEMYKNLKEKGESFEIVLISLDEKEEVYKQGFETMPWLALPFKDEAILRLIRYFELRTIPTAAVIGPDGKTLSFNAAQLIEEHGVDAYPFTPEKLAQIEKAKLEAQSLESILIAGELDFVIKKDGAEVPVSELIGKNILLYFSAHWCPPCRAFLPRLIAAYNEIKAKDDSFEIIFVSSDRDQSSFDDFFSTMPWLALPFGDERKPSLSRRFKIRGIPAAVAIGPDGRTVTTQARQLLQAHGADAFPFTEEHIEKLEQHLEEAAKGWPERVRSELLHAEHELLLTRRSGYVCNGCREMGHGFSFYCGRCDFDLHPKCALKKDEEAGKREEGEWVCDGDVRGRA